MGTQGIEVLRGMEAGAERRGGGAQRGVGDRDLDRRNRVKDGGGVLGLDVAERAATAGAETVEESGQRELGVVVGRGAKPDRGGRLARRR